MKKSIQSLEIVLSIFIFISIFTSCSGAKCTVSAAHIKQPVSYTSCLYNNNGEIIKVNEQQIVKHFILKKNFWTILYKSVSLTNKDWDISTELKQQLSDSKGDAIVNVTSKLTGHAYWYFSALIPIIPSYQTVTIEGDVVKY